MDTMPVYIKEKLDDYSKFDELLGTSEITKVEYIEKETSIDIIALIKCIIKFDRFFDLTKLYDRILNLKVDQIKDISDAREASNYSSGIYFYRVEANNFTETKKMVLLK